MKRETFCMDHYRDLISALKMTQRPVGGFLQKDPQGLILRSDVDFDLTWAAVLARHNRELGVSATFFIQVSSGFYHPWTKSSRTAIREIVESGQEIGLHFSNEGELLDAGRLHQEFGLLQSLAPAALRVVAWHNPGEHLASWNRSANAEGYLSAYEERFFKPDRYIADSNARHDHQAILSFVQQAESPLVQVLLHPILWVIGGHNMKNILDKAFKRKQRELLRLFDDNRVWKETRDENLSRYTLR